MATTITERVYDDLTHKLRQWEKLTPAPQEVLGAIKSWTQLGNADIEAAANAAAGLAVKASNWDGLAKKLRGLASEAKGSANDPALAKRIANAVGALRPQIEAFNKAHPRLPAGSISDSSVMMYVVPLIDPKRYQEKLSMSPRDLRRNLIGSERKFIGQINLMAYQIEQGIKQDEVTQPARSVKAFANVPDVPAALAHLRTAHAAIKAQVDAERSAPPRDGGFAGVGVKAYPVVGAVTKLRDSIHMAGSNGLHIDKAKPVFQRWRAMLLAAGRLDPDVSKENDYRDLMRALSNVRDFQTGRELGQTLSYLVNTADDLLARIS